MYHDQSKVSCHSWTWQDVFFFFCTLPQQRQITAGRYLCFTPDFSLWLIQTWLKWWNVRRNTQKETLILSKKNAITMYIFPEIWCVLVIPVHPTVSCRTCGEFLSKHQWSRCPRQYYHNTTFSTLLTTTEWRECYIKILKKNGTYRNLQNCPKRMQSHKNQDIRTTWAILWTRAQTLNYHMLTIG